MSVMKRLLVISFMLLACTLCAVPTPKWVPARAVMVATAPATTSEDSTQIVAAWLPMITIAASDGWLFGGQDPATKRICALTLAESTKMVHSAESSLTFSLVSAPGTIPSEAEVPQENSMALCCKMEAPEDGAYLFVENPHVDRAALDAAVQDWVETYEGKLVCETYGAWTEIHPVAQESEAEQRMQRIAYREMPGGLVWVYAVERAALDLADGLIAGTAETLADDSPLQKAFSPAVVQARYGGGACVVADWRAVVACEGAHPSLTTLKNLKAVDGVAHFDADGTLTLDGELQYADATTAAHVYDIIRMYKVAWALHFQRDFSPEAGGAALKCLEKFTFEVDGNAVHYTVVLPPKDVYTAYRELFGAASAIPEASHE